MLCLWPVVFGRVAAIRMRSCGCVCCSFCEVEPYWPLATVFELNEEEENLYLGELNGGKCSVTNRRAEKSEQLN